ncbi:glycoside hydrolase family 88 protein [Propionibacteriaceae bacterium G1746]|uniref:glycoside hydrolase family 88 protein n=1 Tax=Aestuariimicrobium sp. G57 TaxID=3418485 RepID=UPI003C1826F8
MGLDPTSAALADPPPQPVPASSLDRDLLVDCAHRVLAHARGLDWSRWFWGEGVVLIGLVRSARALGEPVPALVSDYFDAHPVGSIVVDHVNSLAPGAAAAMIGRTDVGDHLLGWLDAPGSVTLAQNGAVEHWPGGVWADTAYMLGTFLVHHGHLVGRPDLVADAAEQWVRHAEVLQDPVTGLMAHGSHRGEVPPCHWGRANAWLALAACELLESPLLSDDARARITADLSRQLAGVRAALPDEGIWDVLIDAHPETRGIAEASAAAGLVAAMLRASVLGIDTDANRGTAREALCRLLPYLDERGVLTHTSAGTVLQLVPFGYSVIRDDRPQLWGQGLVLQALAAALECLPEMLTTTNPRPESQPSGVE